MGKPHEDPIQTTKTQARANARAAVGRLRQKQFRKKTGRTAFFYLISARMADPRYGVEAEKDSACHGICVRGSGELGARR